MNWYVTVLKKYAEFNGRARRSEYWYFVLISTIISWILMAIDYSVFGTGIEGVGAISSIYSLAVFVPTLAVTVRRLHDTGRSGWNLLWAFLPLIGAILLIVWLATNGQQGSNQYGQNPKEEGEEVPLYE